MRLWPFSRELYPKQFMCFTNDKSMLQNTILRFTGMEEMDAPIIMCNESHRFLVSDQIRALDMKPASIIAEPAVRNTAPAVAAAALKALSIDPDAILFIAPADHHIEDVARFHDAVRIGKSAAEAGYLVTFGIKPLSPETGYGYIQRGEAANIGNQGATGPMTVLRFAEKPDRPTAQAYIESGDYYWNSGMFLFRASDLSGGVGALRAGDAGRSPGGVRSGARISTSSVSTLRPSRPAAAIPSTTR